jgi:hypothetical protein
MHVKKKKEAGSRWVNRLSFAKRFFLMLVTLLPL